MLSLRLVSESLREKAFGLYFLDVTIFRFGPTALVIQLFAFDLRDWH